MGELICRMVGACRGRIIRLVTRPAIRRRAALILPVGVASGAVRIDVSSRQRKSGGVMVERGGGPL